ncbi:2-hydroxychromene-2-carboxylate isomerase [Sneathiella sp.]|jgi:2-hydroxychromene-2-carboxylate isomerase|uniref:2-hydroxychromene-2-carboxylate isomerase n=1 Tax=Sneathiella sp. TaxID=1964365 RepID=UPI0039E617EB
MTITVSLHIDVASPNCYMSHKLIPGIEERQNVTFEYFPVLLGGLFKLTNNQAPFITYKDVKNKPEYNRLEMTRFIRDHDMNKFQMNDHFPINTVPLMRGAIVAEQEGFLMSYLDAILNDMWENNRNMGDPDVIAAALTEHGFDADHILNRIQDQDVKDQLMANTQKSATMGVFGCPTMFVGDEMFFGKDRMDAVEREIIRQKKT